jgi:hypothetical protein
MEKLNHWIRPAALLSILLLFATTWGLAGPGKLASGMPSWFGETFGKTFLATFPGLTLSYYSLAVGETVAFLLALAALVRLEFLPRRSTLVTQVMLVASLLIFVQLGFGQRLVREFDSAANLFFYFGFTLLALSYVRRNESGQD